MAPIWDPGLYLRFENERTQPCVDLVNRIPLDDPREIVDLGCGPGNSTAVLAQRWPKAAITGIDHSPEMLDRARRDRPEIAWQLADIGLWTPDRQVDLVFSNAAFQWIHGHRQVLPRLVESLAPGGVFAMQIPFHLQSALHRAILEVARSGPWSARLAAIEPVFEILAPEQYYDLLAPRATRITLWLTEYQHVMADAEAIVSWIRGTGLRPYLQALEAAELEPFLDRFRRRVEEAFPVRAGGTRILPFPRLFVVLVK
ncbi:MAG: trans-aconitate 2-methyltransferase [Bryobacteraceae bacterium]